MATEKYTTLGASTLDTGYTSGGTTLSPTSAASFPTTGNFRCRVDDEIFKVTAVAGGDFTCVGAQEGTSAANHLSAAVITEVLTAEALDAIRSDMVTSGAYASLPATCKPGDQYYPTDSYYTFVSLATNVWTPFIDGKQCALPAASASWTAVNGGSGTAAKSDSSGAVVLSTTSSVVGIESLIKAVPAAPYKKTFLLSFFGSLGASPSASAIIFAGAGWTDGTAITNAVQMIRAFSFFNNGDGWALGVAHWTSYAYAGGVDDALRQSPLFLTGNRFWVQLEDNNTTRYFRISADGINWVTIFSVARATPFTPSHYGIFGGNQSSGNGLPWTVALISEVTV